MRAGRCTGRDARPRDIDQVTEPGASRSSPGRHGPGPEGPTSRSRARTCSTDDASAPFQVASRLLSRPDKGRLSTTTSTAIVNPVATKAKARSASQSSTGGGDPRRSLLAKEKPASGVLGKNGAIRTTVANA